MITWRNRRPYFAERRARSASRFRALAGSKRTAGAGGDVELHAARSCDRISARIGFKELGSASRTGIAERWRSTPRSTASRSRTASASTPRPRRRVSPYSIRIVALPQNHQGALELRGRRFDRKWKKCMFRCQREASNGTLNHRDVVRGLFADISCIRWNAVVIRLDGDWLGEQQLLSTKCDRPRVRQRRAAHRDQ